LAEEIGDFECNCKINVGDCPKCSGTFLECLQRGKEVSENTLAANADGLNLKELREF
jgi:hypothetical protein